MQRAVKKVNSQTGFQLLGKHFKYWLAALNLHAACCNCNGN